MNLAFERRASTIIFNLVNGSTDKRPILIPANVCPAVPLVLLKARRDYGLIDISRNTLCIDIAQARAALATRRFGGVIFVRTYGVHEDVEDCFASFRRADPSAVLIDDRCLCPPEIEEAPESAADAVLFSTGYAKYVDLGFGGFAWIRDGVPYRSSRCPYSAAADKLIEAQYKEAMRSRSRYEYVDSDWLDTREHELQVKDYKSAVLMERRRALELKTKLTDIYARQIPIAAQLPRKFQNWRFNILVREKASLLAALTELGLFASSHYASLGGVFGGGQFPEAEALHSEVINLFCDKYYDASKAGQTADIVSRHVAQAGVGAFSDFK